MACCNFWGLSYATCHASLPKTDYYRAMLLVELHEPGLFLREIALAELTFTGVTHTDHERPASVSGMEVDAEEAAEQQDGVTATAEGVLDTEEAVAAEFAHGGAAAQYRNQWLCVKANFVEKQGIVFLRTALGGKTVADGVIGEWFPRGGSDKVTQLLSAAGLLVGGVRVFKAAPVECFGRGAKKYLAFGNRPSRVVKVEMEARNAGTFVRDDGAADTAVDDTAVPPSSSSSSSSLPLGYYEGPGYLYHDSKRQKRASAAGAAAAVAADQESDAAFMARVEPPPQQQRGQGQGQEKGGGGAAEAAAAA